MVAFTQRRRTAKRDAQARAAAQESYRSAQGRKEKAGRRADHAAAAMQQQYRAAQGQAFKLNPDASVRPTTRPNTVDFPERIVIPEEDRRNIPPSRTATEILRQAWRDAAKVVGGIAQHGVELARYAAPVLRQSMVVAAGAVGRVGLRLAKGGANFAVRAPLRTMAGVTFAYFCWQGQHMLLAEPKINHHVPKSVTVTPLGSQRDVPGFIAPTRQREATSTLVVPKTYPSSGMGSEIGAYKTNNPGNIVRSNIPWTGKIFANEDRFEKFATPQDGLNAMAQNLVSYGQRGLNTVAGIVGRWAPRHENNTAQYAARVAEEIGVQPTTPLNMGNAATLRSLMAAMIRQENSEQPFAPVMLDRAAALALGTVMPERTYAAASPNSGNLVSAVEICKTIVGMDATLTSGFGARRGEHEGIDCATSRGSAIVAIFGGVVREKGYDGGYGNMVKICDGDVCGIYAHAERFAPLRIGSVVTPGQEIAYVGNTGTVRGPTGLHAHYELRIKDQPTNPSSLRGVLAMGLASLR